MEAVGEKISSKMEEGFLQLMMNIQNQQNMVQNNDSLFQRVITKIGQKQKQGIQQLYQRVIEKSSQQENNGGILELLMNKIANKQSQAFDDFSSNVQKGLIKIDQNEMYQNKTNLKSNYSNMNNEQFFNPGMPNFHDFRNYQQNNQNQMFQVNPGMPLQDNMLHQDIYSAMRQNMNNEMAYKFAQQNMNHNINNQMAYNFAQQNMNQNRHDAMAYNFGRDHINSIKNNQKDIQVYQQNNPQNIYRKQFKTKDANKITKHKNKSKQQYQNKFSAYKKQLANLEDKTYDQINYKNNEFKGPGSFQRQQMEPKLANTEKMQRKYHQFNRKKSQKKIYQINKEQLRKHSYKKQKEAQSQMMANIEFLKSLRGSSNFSNHKKQWKQDTRNIKDTLDQIKQAKKKQLQTLGFSSPSKLLRQSKLSDSMVSIGMENAHQSNLLPQIRKSRKKALIHKPAPFTVYTIQKDNEIFVNKFTS